MLESKLDCDLCEEAFSYHPGVKGENADLTKILFVLHRSDSREPQPRSSATYREALLKSQTGKVLTEMLEFCDLTIEDIYLTNVFKCLLPKDREPRAKEYKSCIKVLEEQVTDFDPKKILVFGRKSYEHMFPEIAKQNSYKKMVMKALDFNGVPSLVSYHPSWMWSFKPKKRKGHYKKIKKFLT